MIGYSIHQQKKSNFSICISISIYPLNRRLKEKKKDEILRSMLMLYSLKRKKRIDFTSIYTFPSHSNVIDLFQCVSFVHHYTGINLHFMLVLNNFLFFLFIHLYISWFLICCVYMDLGISGDSFLMHAMNQNRIKSNFNITCIVIFFHLFNSTVASNTWRIILNFFWSVSCMCFVFPWSQWTINIRLRKNKQ